MISIQPMLCKLRWLFPQYLHFCNGHSFCYSCQHFLRLYLRFHSTHCQTSVAALNYDLIQREWRCNMICDCLISLLKPFPRRKKHALTSWIFLISLNFYVWQIFLFIFLTDCEIVMNCYFNETRTFFNWFARWHITCMLIFVLFPCKAHIF